MSLYKYHLHTYTHIPIINACSNFYRKILVPDFNFYPGRNERGMMIKNVEYAPDYKPNYEYGKKSLGSCGIKFAKMSSRKPLNLGHVSLNDDWLDPETFNKVHPFR